MEKMQFEPPIGRQRPGKEEVAQTGRQLPLSPWVVLHRNVEVAANDVAAIVTGDGTAAAVVASSNAMMQVPVDGPLLQPWGCRKRLVGAPNSMPPLPGAGAVHCQVVAPVNGEDVGQPGPVPVDVAAAVVVAIAAATDDC